MHTQANLGIFFTGLFVAVIVFTVCMFIANDVRRSDDSHDNWVAGGIFSGVIITMFSPASVFILGHFIAVLITILSLGAFIAYLLGTYHFMKRLRRGQLRQRFKQFFHLFSLNAHLERRRLKTERELAAAEAQLTELRKLNADYAEFELWLERKYETQ